MSLARKILLVRLWAYLSPLVVAFPICYLCEFSSKSLIGGLIGWLLYCGVFRFFDLVEPLNQSGLRKMRSSFFAWLVMLPILTIVWIVWRHEPLVRFGIPGYWILQILILPWDGLFESDSPPEADKNPEMA